MTRNHHLVPMNGANVSGRELRRKLNADSNFLGAEIAPRINQLLHNDQTTQGKVTALESWIAAWQAQSFWQRLRWLFRGVR